MKSKIILLFFVISTFFGCNTKNDNLITEYGAIADGVSNNAVFIQKAIDEVSAAGGGQVVVPPGNFMTGTLYLKSGVDLHLEQGATLLGPHNTDDYTNKGRSSLIYAEGQKNISISGKGIIDGQGQELMLDIFGKLRSGELKNIDIQNVTAKNTGNAIFIRRGHRNTAGEIGTLKGVYIANVKAEIPLYKPDQGYPIEGPPDHLRPGEDKMPKRPSHFHIYGHPFLPYNLIPSSIVGLPGFPVEDVTLENIEISYGGMANKDIAYIPLNEISSVPENAAGYPEFSMWGELPSWGFYVRHVDGLTLNNVRMNVRKEDFRPAYVFDDVRNLTIANGKISSLSNKSQLILKDTERVKIENQLVDGNRLKEVPSYGKNTYIEGFELLNLPQY